MVIRYSVKAIHFNKAKKPCKTYRKLYFFNKKECWIKLNIFGEFLIDFTSTTTHTSVYFA